MKQKGNIIVLMALMLAAIMPLLGLSIGSGTLFINRSRMQNAANLAALSGLQAFVSPENLGLTIAERAEKARSAVDAILKKNKPFLGLGTSANANLFDGSNSGTKPLLTFGKLLDGTFTKHPSGSDLEAATRNLEINAAQVEIKTQVSSFIAPFLSLLGSNTKNISFVSSATSSILPRCAVFLLDVSNSSFTESHTKLPANLYDENYSLSPTSDPDLKTQPDINLFYHISPHDSDLKNTFIANKTILGNYAIPVQNLPALDFCESHANLNARYNDGRAYWCSMKPTRPDICKNGAQISGCNWGQIPCCAPHYRDDYAIADTPSGRFMIDRYSLPDPFNSFLEAANSSLRQINATQTAQDKVAVVAFSGKEHAGAPEVGLSPDTRFAIDLTDIRRGMDYKHGITSAISPNYIDRDWFPVDVEGGAIPGLTSKSGTDILGVLHEAIGRLTDTAYCPAKAQKTVFLASDGVMTQVKEINSPHVKWSVSHPIQNSSDWLNAVIIASYLPHPVNNIAADMVKNKIRFVMLLAGEKIAPNFLEVEKNPKKVCTQFENNCTLNKDGDFYAPWELPALGIKGNFTNPPMMNSFSRIENYADLPRFTQQAPACRPKSASDSRLTDENECARLYHPVVPNFPYRAPNGPFSELAVVTNGLFCPLMEPYRKPDGTINDDCYDASSGLKKGHTGKAECAMTTGVDKIFQTKSFIRGEKGQQAAFCANMSFGTPTFSLETVDSVVP